MADQVLGFYMTFAVTLLAVGVTAVLGRRAHRPAHIASAVLTAALLTYTIYLAEALGRVLELPRGPLSVHLVFANGGALAFIAVIVTGSRLFRLEQEARRRWHRRAVAAFLVLAVCAAATGTYMISRARERTETSQSSAAPVPR